MQEKKLFLIRGVSGSGKTKFGKSISEVVISADDFFMKNGVYEWSADGLQSAHDYSFNETERHLSAGTETVCVANTFTREKELNPYINLGNKYGYTIFSVIVENRHGNVDEHNVPPETIKKQDERIRGSIKLAP